LPARHSRLGDGGLILSKIPGVFALRRFLKSLPRKRLNAVFIKNHSFLKILSKIC
jgi:hypothetical protein